MDVELVRWPAGGAKRARCRELGVPRLLIIEGPVPPPTVDPLEDWVRMPLSPDDLRARITALAARARELAVPTVDDNHVLHRNTRSVALSPIEGLLATEFVRAYRQVVTRQVLTTRVWAGREAPQRNALDLHMLRLRRKITPVGLVIRTVRGRGYLLTSNDE